MARVTDLRVTDLRVTDLRVPEVHVPWRFPAPRRFHRFHAARAMVLVVGLLAGLSTACAGGDEAPGPETAPDVTLRHLVDVARRNKAAELAAATARLAGLPGPSGDPALPMPPRSRGAAPAGGPRLWSLVAAGDRWRAEVLLGGRLHAVNDTSGPETRIGPWRILGLMPEGLCVEQVAAGGRPPRRLVLAPPARGTAVAGHRFEGVGSRTGGRHEPVGAGRLGDDAGHEAGDDASDAAGDDAGDDGDAAVHRAASLPLSPGSATPAAQPGPATPAAQPGPATSATPPTPAAPPPSETASVLAPAAPSSASAP